jgi:hypothetical protein
MTMAAAVVAVAEPDGLARTPLRGWNSWNWVGTAGCSDRCERAGMAGRCHSEVMMRQMTDALATSNLSRLNFEYQITHCPHCKRRRL